MHVQFNPENSSLWLHYFAEQAGQTGYGLDGYRGVPYQRGGGLGSFFRSLFRMAVPVLKSIGRNVGKHALAAGSNIASDLAQGKPLFPSAKQHTKHETAQLLGEASRALQSGEGIGIRPKSINTPVQDVFSTLKRKQNGFDRHKIDSKHKKRA